MRFLIEAHHPAHIHFWKYPIRELISRGHRVLMIGRDRDVMRRLLMAYDWIPSQIPKRDIQKNRFPLKEMFERQWAVGKAIHLFRPDLMASLMGSYAACTKLFNVKNVVFTDTETQHFNHFISHPFADQIMTPNCFWKPLGSKQVKYGGLHELSFIRKNDIVPVSDTVRDPYIVIRLSAWNTMHDVGKSGLGSQVIEFVSWASNKCRILISAEEGSLPKDLEKYRMSVQPEDYHKVISGALIVLTEGASTASEAACLGVPVVYINSTKSLGYLDLLSSNYGLVQITDGPEDAVFRTKCLMKKADPKTIADYRSRAHRLHADHPKIDGLVARMLEAAVIQRLV